MGLIWGLVVVVALLACVGVFAVPLAKWWQQREALKAIERFQIQREMLEAKFFDLAQSLGKPRGLKWRDCEWFAQVVYARDRNSGLLTAFVGINVRFEAIEGGDMEGVAAVDTVRDAVAVFHFHQGTWGTGGKALFNMNPTDVVQRLSAQFDPV